VITLPDLLQAVAQTTQAVQPVARGPGGPPPGFSFAEAATELVGFVGYFLSIGAVGFRYGIVRRTRDLTDEARGILRADNAALLGLLGVLLLALAALGAPYLRAITDNKTFAESLPKNLAAFEFKLAMLAVALVGFALVRASASLGWIIAAVGVLSVVLLPVYTGRLAGKINAVHVLAASTWLGTLLVLAIVGIGKVARSASPGEQRAVLVADLVNSFSPLALTAATIVALSGATTAWLHLKRLSALYTTSYGITLMIKLLLVLIVASLGAWNWKRVRPSLGAAGSEQTIRRSARMELVFAGLVLIVTSVLVTLPSPR
jgi:putative copper export protein